MMSPVALPWRPAMALLALSLSLGACARKELSASLIERDEEVDLVLTALLANEHVLLVGPPGCGKSLLLDAVMNRPATPSGLSCPSDNQPISGYRLARQICSRPGHRAAPRVKSLAGTRGMTRRPSAIVAISKSRRRWAVSPSFCRC